MIAKRECPKKGKEEAQMSLTMIIVMLVCGWLAVAAAMLWGVLRITRRHHHPVQPAPAPEADETSNQHANAH
ncbi:hypothetical protein VC35_24270 [Pseudomonas fluorescens]|uniref:Uncharacterized protein n=2 Tax=Pseudomonas TaxID=286 RepID=A0A0F4T9G5_PSEFL|nr:hypothetical protein VC35_24270 [Pseudomonas fluorescens]